MIQQPQISIEKNAPFNFGSGFFRVVIIVPGEIGETIGAACTEAKNCYFGGATCIAGESAEVYDYEFDGNGLLWADTIISSTHVGAMRNEDGSFTLSIICEKEAEGDDRYDWHGFEKRMDGELPDNFWIEPARIIRKLISAAKH